MRHLIYWAFTFALVGISEATASSVLPINSTNANELVGSALSTGPQQACAIKASDHSLQCWGRDISTVPTAATGKYQEVSVGVNVTCAITLQGGQIECWAFGADTWSLASPNAVGRYHSISVGSEAACAINDETNNLYCWGATDSGYQGAPSLTTSEFHSVSLDTTGGACGILLSTGVVDCWGVLSGTIPSGYSTYSFDSVSVSGDLACGLRSTATLTASDNRILCWGRTTSPTISTAYAQSDWTGLSLYGSRLCGVLTSTNALVCFGPSFSTSTPTYEQFVWASVGDGYGCGLHLNFTVTCWGSDTHSQASPFSATDSVGLDAYQEVIIDSGTGNDSTCATTYTCSTLQGALSAFEAFTNVRYRLRNNDIITSWSNISAGFVSIESYDSSTSVTVGCATTPCFRIYVYKRSHDFFFQRIHFTGSEGGIQLASYATHQLQFLHCSFSHFNLMGSSLITVSNGALSSDCDTEISFTAVSFNNISANYLIDSHYCSLLLLKTNVSTSPSISAYKPRNVNIEESLFQNVTGAVNGAVALVGRDHTTITTSFSTTRSNFYSCQATTGHGGALYLYDVSSVSITSSHFSDCSAPAGNGGAIAMLNEGQSATEAQMVVTDLNLIGNVALTSGGVLYLSSAWSDSVSITNINCRYNYAQSGSGGCLYLYWASGVSASVSLVQVTAYHNGAGQNGGAIVAESKSGGHLFFTASGLALSYNYADLYGGGLYLVSAMGTLSQAVFDYNSASHQGGGAHVALSILTISGARFEYNDHAPHSSEGDITAYSFSPTSAQRGGAGVTVHHAAEITISNTTFANNGGTTLGASGGGLLLEQSTETTLSSVTFRSNEASYGGAIFAKSTELLVFQSSVELVLNSATYHGGGLYLYYSQVDLGSGTIFSSNTAERGQQIFFSADTSSGSDTTYVPTTSSVTFNCASSCDDQLSSSIQSLQLSDSVVWLNQGDSISVSMTMIDYYGYTVSQTIQSAAMVSSSYTSHFDSGDVALSPADSGLLTFSSLTPATASLLPNSSLTVDFSLVSDDVFTSIQSDTLTLKSYPCQAGTYFDGSQCISCSGGYYNGAETMEGSSACSHCLAGTYSVDGSSPTSCTSCDLGKYTSANASTGCTTCAEGKYADATGLSACLECAINTYASTQGSTECIACNSGYEATSEGSTTCTYIDEDDEISIALLVFIILSAILLILLLVFCHRHRRKVTELRRIIHSKDHPPVESEDEDEKEERLRREEEIRKENAKKKFQDDMARRAALAPQPSLAIVQSTDVTDTVEVPIDFYAAIGEEFSQDGDGDEVGLKPNEHNMYVENDDERDTNFNPYDAAHIPDSQDFDDY